MVKSVKGFLDDKFFSVFSEVESQYCSCNENSDCEVHSIIRDIKEGLGEIAWFEIEEKIKFLKKKIEKTKKKTDNSVWRCMLAVFLPFDIGTQEYALLHFAFACLGAKEVLKRLKELK